MHCITQTFNLCYGHRLLGEAGKPAQIHGHSATVILTLQNTALNSLNEHVYVMRENPTEENIARMIYNRANEFSLPVESVEVWDTENTRAIYTREPEETKTEV